MLVGPICPTCEATYENCPDCGDTGSVALWKPEEFKKHQQGGGCWTWLGKREEVGEDMERFRQRNSGMELEARVWPSGERVGR